MKSYSEFDTVPALVGCRRETHGEHVAVTFDGQSCAFAELDERSSRVHGWLVDTGVRPGDNVAILMRNSLELLYAWLGTAKAGAVAVTINTALVGDSLEYILDHSEAVGILADADLLTNVDASGGASSLRWRAALGELSDAQTAGVEPFEALTDHSGPRLESPSLGGGSPMSIIYTSGTTGMPKGVVLSHRSYLNTGAYFARHLGLTADDRLHTCLPLFHCNAQQTTFMAGLSLGARVALNERFSVSRFWDWIGESGATVTNLLGTMLALLAKVPEAPGDERNSLRYILAAPVPEQLYRPFEERFGLRLVEGYGLTETATMCIINPVDDVRPGTIGLPLEHNEVRVVDDEDLDVPEDTPGEIVTRTRIPDAFMTGYFKEPRKTAEALRGGWFHTGDMGLRRTDGYYVFLDRLKDTIRRRGENISSFELEKTIAAHLAVRECAVFGVPSELGEEDVKVCAVLQPDADLPPEDLVAWCRERMAGFMVPRYVEFRQELPLTETGRVHKYALREEGVGEAWDGEASGSNRGTGVREGTA